VGVCGGRAALQSWLEESSLRGCTASYCRLHPAPRSTIAAAFSPDGALLASTQCVP
jgi:activator-of-BECN1-regulated-autophagy protein 1